MNRKKKKSIGIAYSVSEIKQKIKSTKNGQQILKGLKNIKKFGLYSQDSEISDEFNVGQIKEVIWPDLHLIIEANMWRIKWKMPRLWIELV